MSDPAEADLTQPIAMTDVLIPEQGRGESRRISLSCPSCNTSVSIDPARRDAEGFCPRCDYPLFWAEGQRRAPDSESDGSSLRRLPGTAGRHALAAFPCPNCTEPNPPANETCLRCGAELRPAPLPPPPPPAPEPVVAPVVEPVVVERTNWWPYIVAAVVAVALIVLMLLAFD